MLIGLLSAVVVGLCVYFFVLPLFQEDDVEIKSVETIWQDEVVMGSNSLLLYPHYSTDQIQSIAIHNPNNEADCVDWGFFYNEKEDKKLELAADQFYLTGYTYAPFDEELLSQMITTTGFVICSSRMEDHCADYSRYGLDYTDLSEKVYFTLTTRDGIEHTVLIGSKTPTGSGYYVRSLDESVDLATGEKRARDSVYILSSVYFQTTVLSTPMAMVTPYLGMPINTANPLDSFALFVNEEKYYYPDKEGEEDIWQPAIHMEALNADKKDPFSIFTGVSLYKSKVPKGYYSSTEMEGIISAFEEFLGESVVAMEHDAVDENGEITTQPLDDEIMKKYGLDNPYYQLFYSSGGIHNVIYFSKLQENSYYYAYCLNFNMICKVNAGTAYFLSWDLESYVSSHIFITSIANIQSIGLKGSYFDLGVEQDFRGGRMDVDINFRLDGRGTDLIVTDTVSGKVVDTANTRQFYGTLMQADIREQMDEEEIAKAKLSDPILTITVVTKETVVYKTDESGKATTDVDFIRPSVTRIFRYYECSEGRSLITTEDIDQNGKSLGERGDFYGMSAAAQKLMSDALDLLNGVAIDNSLHG